MQRSPDQGPPRRTLSEFAREVGANRQRLTRLFGQDSHRPKPLPLQPISCVLHYCQAELRRWWSGHEADGA